MRNQYVYFSEIHILLVYRNMPKKLLFCVAIVALIYICIYPSIASCCNVYAQQPEIIYKQQLGSKGSENGQFNTPHSLAVDSFGNIYVGDTGNKRIEKFSPNGTFVASWGTAGTNNGQFLGLHDITVDPEGKFVYSLELNNHRVQKFDSNGTFITKWGYNGTGGRDAQRSPHQIAVNSMGIVYLTDRNGNQILKFYSNGNFIETIGSKGAGPGQFDGPHGIAIDSDNDNVYVTDMKNHRIQVFDSNDSFIRQWGSFGNGTGQFSDTATGIALDNNNNKNNNVYVIDKINTRVQMFDKEGNYLTGWGSYGKGPEQLNEPEDIAVDNKGLIYVTDTRNSRIQILEIKN
jgi:tripartite motif-containing protein 71